MSDVVHFESGFSIRRAQASDRDRMYEICLKTGDFGQDASPLFRHGEMLGDIYAGPYLEFEPDLCFLLCKNEEVLGYAIAARDSRVFATRVDEKWWPMVRAKYHDKLDILNENERRLWEIIARPFEVNPELMDKYPSHLHIDLIGTAQGQGLGRVLMEHLLAALKGADTCGVHLGVAKLNVYGIKFYEKTGFIRLAEDRNTLFYGRQFT
ncbi:MAG: GNAT family N-acetyltransferase [Actinomycetes bacterium]